MPFRPRAGSSTAKMTDLMGMTSAELVELVKDATTYEEALRAWVGYFTGARTWNSYQATTSRLRIMFPSTSPDSRVKGFFTIESANHKAIMEEFHGPNWRRTISTPEPGRPGAGPEVVGEALEAAVRAAAEEAAAEEAQEAGDGRAAGSAARPDPPLTAETLALVPRAAEHYHLGAHRASQSAGAGSVHSVGSRASRRSLPVMLHSLEVFDT